ncbi:MAG: aldo/keto reductase, partial [Eubacteriales bacterium]|nr:aldo/keto reductase [Eubacteriales bacterium]
FSQGKTDLLNNTTLGKIASRHGKTPAQVALRFLVQQGITVIPKSDNEHRIRENIDLFDFALSDDDLAALQALDTKKSAGLTHDDPANVSRIVAL